MTEVFEMDPQNMVVDVIEEHSVRSDQMKLGYIAGLTLIGSLLGLTQLAGRYQIGDREGAERMEMVLAATGAIAIFFLVVLPLLRKSGILPATDTGSRIVLSKRAIYWWRGKLPRQEHRISVDDIASVVFEDDPYNEADSMVLKDHEGFTIEFPEACVKNPRHWAWTLTKHFPQISYDWTDQYPSLSAKR